MTGRSYGSLDPLAIANLGLAGHQIPRSMIPTYIDLGFFGVGSRVVFGMRTNEGRLARCRAWINGLDGRLVLEWVTFDNPVASLDLTQRWCVAEQGEVTDYITADCQRCTSAEVAWCGVVEAWPRLAPFPIDYQWCLCGHVIEEGKGEVPGPDGPISYTLTDRKLCIEGDLGQDIECEVCVSAIDARGHELYECLRLSQPGTKVTCRPCVPHRPYDIHIAEVVTELQGYRPVFELARAAEPVG